MKKLLLMSVVLFLAVLGCAKESLMRSDKTSEPVPNNFSDDRGGGDAQFKVPLLPGYNWEVTQSWGDHCTECDEKYPGGGSYCVDTHTSTYCLYGWDFNLPSRNDEGLSVLASGNGHVKTVSNSQSWGYYVILDHGDNLCTRYAHMVSGSTGHLTEGQYACQGLKLGEIGNTGVNNGDGDPTKGFHLHFQFENCDDHLPVPRGFDDGNTIPVCTKGDDRFDSSGNYNFLILSNAERTSCTQANPSGGNLPDGKWAPNACGAITRCPRIPSCGRRGEPSFNDLSANERIEGAVNYLWRECVVNGKSDGGFHPNDPITMAEAMKVSMFTSGMMQECGVTPDDLANNGNWYSPIFLCAISNDVVSPTRLVYPFNELDFATAAMVAVEPAVKKGLIQILNPLHGHFENVIPRGHAAYGYAETLYAFGGLTHYYSSDQQVTRGEFALMVAALSSCFCGSVNCTGGCTCNQSAFICEGGGQNSCNCEPCTCSCGESSPTGNEDEPGETVEVNPPDPPRTSGGTGEPEEVNLHVEPLNLAADCRLRDPEPTCEGQNPVMRVVCEMRNNGNRSVRIRNLIMHPVDGSCEMTNDSLVNSGAGYQIVDPGENQPLTGSFEMRCDRRPTNGILEVSLDLLEKKTDGTEDELHEDLIRTNVHLGDAPFDFCDPEEQCVAPTCERLQRECGNWAWYNGNCAGEISCGSCATGVCQDGECIVVYPDAGPSENQNSNGSPPDSGVNVSSDAGVLECTTNLDYTVRMSSEGGSYEMVWGRGRSNDVLTNRVTSVTLPCTSLPLAIWIHGGPSGVHLEITDSRLPDAYFWFSPNVSVLALPIQLSPSMVRGKVINLPTPYLSVVVYIPAF